MTHTNHLLHHYAESLFHAAEKHLRLDDNISVHHLADSRAEIDNRTCLQAFLHTFEKKLRQAPIIHQEHETILSCLNGFTQEVLHTVQAEVDFATLILHAKRIIESYMD